MGKQGKDIEKQLEEALCRVRDVEEQSRAWLEYSPACTKIVDLDLNLQYMSCAGIEGLCIGDVTEYYGKPFPFDFYPEPVKKRIAENLKKVIKTGEIITQETPAFNTRGEDLWFHTTFVPVKDKDGRTEYVIAVSIDITERKNVENKLRDHQLNLEAVVEVRTKDLSQKVVELESALAHIKRLEGLVPICCQCKKMLQEEKDPSDHKAWIPLERYISDRTEARFTHGLCPECLEKFKTEGA